MQSNGMMKRDYEHILPPSNRGTWSEIEVDACVSAIHRAESKKTCSIKCRKSLERETENKSKCIFSSEK